MQNFKCLAEAEATDMSNDEEAAPDEGHHSTA